MSDRAIILAGVVAKLVREGNGTTKAHTDSVNFTSYRNGRRWLEHSYRVLPATAQSIAILRSGAPELTDAMMLAALKVKDDTE